MGFFSFISDALDAYNGIEKISVKSVENIIQVSEYDGDVSVSNKNYPIDFSHEYTYSSKSNEYTMARFRKELLNDFRYTHRYLSDVTENDIYIPEGFNYLCLCPDVYLKGKKYSVLAKFKMTNNGKEMTWREMRNFFPKYYNSPFGYRESWTEVEITDVPKHSSYYDDD